MDDAALAAVEAGVDRLLAAYDELQKENSRLRGQLADLEEKQNVCRKRLDRLLTRLGDVVVP